MSRTKELSLKTTFKTVYRFFVHVGAVHKSVKSLKQLPVYTLSKHKAMIAFSGVVFLAKLHSPILALFWPPPTPVKNMSLAATCLHSVQSLLANFVGLLL